MDPRVSLLIAAHDRTHRDLENLTEEVRKNHVELGNRLSVLDTRTEAIGARITAEVGLIDRKIDAVEHDLAIVKDHVILMTGKFGELDEKFTGRLDEVDARFDEVDARFDKVDARFDKMDARFDKMDARFDKMDARFDKMDARFDQVLQLLGAEPRE
jgi:phage shock protein A